MLKKIFLCLSVVGLSGCLQVDNQTTVRANGDIEFVTHTDMSQLKAMSDMMREDVAPKKSNKKTKVSPELMPEVNCAEMLKESLWMQNQPQCVETAPGVFDVTGRLSASEVNNVIQLSDANYMHIDTLGLFAMVGGMKSKVNEFGNTKESTPEAEKKAKAMMRDLKIKIMMTLSLPGRVIKVNNVAVHDGLETYQFDLVENVNKPNSIDVQF